MTAGGNAKAREFFRQHGWDKHATSPQDAHNKYHSRAAQLYRGALDKAAAQAQGLPTSPEFTVRALATTRTLSR